MSYWTTGLAVIAGLCIAFGLLDAFLGWARKSQRRIHFTFSALALATAASVLASRTAYLADTAEEYFAAEAATYTFIAMTWIALLWFVADYSGFRPRPVLGALTLFMGVIAFGGAVGVRFFAGRPEDLSAVELPWGEEVVVRSSESAGIGPIAEAAVLLGVAFVVAAIVQQYRRGDSSRATFLVAGAGWGVATVIADLVIQGRVAEFVYLSDIGFLGFVIAIGVQSARSTVETEQSLLAYQSNLIAMVDERTEELRRAQTELVEQAAERAAADERGRLARDLHDVVTQTLFSVNLIASSLPRLWHNDPDQAERSTSELRRLTRAAMAEMRTLLRELRPDTIAYTKLDTLIGQLVEGLAVRHDLESEVHIELTGALPPSVHIAIYRITQEALNNAGKHANADRLLVSLRGDGHRATLRIADDGAGFDQGSVGNGSMGLAIMHERASAIGAHLEIHTAPGSGTSVEVDWSDIVR